MAQGASTPIEVRVAGKNMDDIKNMRLHLLDKLQTNPFSAGCANCAALAFADDSNSY